MRCLSNALAVSWCVFFASLLGSPTAYAADSGRDNVTVSTAGAVVSDQSIATAGVTAPARGATIERYGELPLSFEANQGQTGNEARFLSRGNGFSLFLTRQGAVLALAQPSQPASTVLRMQLAGANRQARIQGLDELPGKTNYFFGSDARRWRVGVPTYSRVAYENIYPGINLVYYGNQRQLEYDFVVAAGADPRQIRLNISGAEKLAVDDQGNLVMQNAAGDVQLLAPKVYQKVNGRQQPVAGQWALISHNVAGFRLGSYDHTQALVIDPVLMYSSFLGGSQTNTLTKIAIDAAGNAYVAGNTSSGDFPAAPTPQSMTFGAGSPSRGAFVAKIDPTGSNLLYTTYLSGSVSEEATGLAVDKSGNVYVAGTTHSPDFPTRNAFQSTCNTHVQAGTCSSAFLAKIAPTGDSLVFSTYLGGSGGESGRSLAVDAADNAYLVGATSSVDFPVTPGAAEPKCGGACQQNAFVAKFNPTGDSLAYATYLGGSGTDDAAELAVDASGSEYIAGRTTSSDFPLAAPFQNACTPDATSTTGACVATAFVAKIKPDGSAFEYSTYLGGSLGSRASGIAVDSLGSAYVAGSTQSPDFPVQHAFQKSCGIDLVSHACSVDAFVTKLAPSGKSLVYSTYIGGSGRDEAAGIVLDSAGNAHIIGHTESTDFPTTASLQAQLKGTSDAFVARLSADGTALTFSTYHGGSALESGSGIALDGKSNVYLTGQTSSSDFPTHMAFQSSCAGACTSAFVTKMSALPLVTAPPSISKNFGVASVALNATTTLSFTINNPNAATTLTGIGFTDTLPAGLVISTPNGLSGTCGGGTITATAGTNSIDLAGASLAGAASCTFSVNVDGTAAGTQNNLTAAVTSVEGGNGNTASASIDVVAPPSIAKAFNPTTIAVNGTTTLTLTITNPAANPVAEAGVAFTDTLPLNLVVATPNGLSNACGGTATATAGSTSISLTGGTIATNSTCTVVVNVTGNTAADYTNTTGAVSSTNGGTGNTASAPLSVAAAPSIVKVFGAATIPLNGTTSLTFTINNPNATVPLTGVAFTDSLPAGLVVASPNALSNTCNGTATAVAGSGSVSLSSGTLATSASCTVSLNVTGTTAGVKSNSVTVSATEGGTGNTSTANITVVAPPTFNKLFGAASVPLNGTTTLTFTVNNPNATVALTGIAFTDTLPAGLVVSTPNGVGGSCGAGSITATAGTNVISLTGANLAAAGTCNFHVSVTGTAAGNQNNTTGAITSTEGGTGLTTSASITVVAPPSIAKAFNPASIKINGTTTLTFTITNPAANTVAETTVAFTDGLPANMLVATPNGLSNTCGGTATAVAGSTSITLAAGTIAVNTSCTVVVNVTATVSGNYTNTSGAVSSANGGTGNTASANLFVASPPTITKAFGAATVVLNNSTSLTLTISNPNTTVALTGVAVADNLPAGLMVATPNGLSNTCGGTATATAGSSAVSLSSGTLAASASCTIAVNVTGTTSGAKNNTTGAVTSTEGGAGTTSNTATVTVQDFNWTISSSAATVIESQSTSSTTSPVLTATPISGYSQNITVSCTVSPATATVTCTPNPATITGGNGPSTVTINTTAATPIGVYTVTISGSDNSTVQLKHSQPFTLTVECTWNVGAGPTVNADATSGGKYSITLAVASGGTQCPWAVTGATSSWIHSVAASGVGSSTVLFDVDSFYGAADTAPRMGTLNFDFTNGTNGIGFTQPTGSSTVTQNEVVMNPIAPSSASSVHVNSGAQIPYTTSATNTANLNALWSVTGTCNGPCGNIPAAASTTGTYTAPANIAASAAPHTSATDTVSAASQADPSKLSANTPTVNILNDQPLCTGAAAVMPDPLHSAVNPATGAADPINNPVAIKVQHLCTDNQDNENDLQGATVFWGDGSPSPSITFSNTGVASGTINPAGTDANFSHAFAAANFNGPAYAVSADPVDTSAATAPGASIVPTQVVISYVASDNAALFVTAAASNSQPLPTGSQNVTFTFGSGSDPCSPATNANGFAISGIVRSDGTTDPANFGITCSLAMNATFQTLTVNTTSATNPATAARRSAKLSDSLVLLSLGVPCIVFLGLGFSGSRRSRRMRRVLCVFGILTIIAALILLPACGGGISVKVVNPGTKNVVYFLALTGTSGGAQQTYIVPLTVAPQQ
ncbi:MAG TPA: SBBP repeat-containing protein [Candidatus Nitrosotalea sp.]|nr:SBBP repeat-containing protein [Candidatus Nitrosotalea sp.]